MQEGGSGVREANDHGLSCFTLAYPGPHDPMSEMVEDGPMLSHLPANHGALPGL